MTENTPPNPEDESPSAQQPDHSEQPIDDNLDVSAAFAQVKSAIAERQKVKLERPALAFVILMLGLAAIMTTLGIWQLARLSEKQVLIARIENRLKESPRVLPPVREWKKADPEKWDFRPVKIKGSFESDETVLIFTNLTGANGRLSGPGYWVVTPFAKHDGGTVFINRGFIPQDLKDTFLQNGVTTAAVETITGIARAPERVNAFTPGPDFAGRIDWITNVDRLSKFLQKTPEGIAPFYVDQAVSSTEPLPQGGETKVELPNRHMQYVITWFSLAGMVPILLVFWLFRRK